MAEKKKACNIPCSQNVIDEDRCECVNVAKTIPGKEHGVGSVSVNFHYCSREERNDLIMYLEEKCWDFEETSIFIDNEETES